MPDEATLASPLGTESDSDSGSRPRKATGPSEPNSDPYPYLPQLSIRSLISLLISSLGQLVTKTVMEASLTLPSTSRPQIIYKSSIPDIHIPKHNVFEHIFPAIDSHNGEKSAVIDGLTGETLSRNLLKRHSLTLAAAMVDSLGLRKGQAIMILSPNSIQYPIVLLAALAAGLQVTFANPFYTPSELRHQIHDSKSACIFAHHDALPALQQALGTSSIDTKKRTVLMSHTSTIPPSVLSEGWLLLDDLLADSAYSRQLEQPVAFDGQDAVTSTAFLYYSSGTTGRSKGVETTHYNMVSALEMSTANWGALRADVDVMLAVIPWYHITGGCVTLLYPLHMATPIVVLPAFQPKTFLGAVEKYHATAMVVAPPILLFLQNSPLVEEYDLGSLSVILCGSAPASKALITNTMDRLNHLGSPVTIGQAYGLTETSPGTHVTPPAWARRKAGKVGRLQPNMEARLVDNDEFDVPRGQRGELWVRGPNVMKGYLGNEEATTNAVTRDGWLKTGDIAVIDDEGFAQIVDRKKELIKFKGFQVPPAELEALLLTHPAVADAGVIGVFSQQLQTELPRAYVVPRDPTVLSSGVDPSKRHDISSAIEQWVQSRVVQYKRLRGGVILVNQIPRSAAGKILRNDLRNLAKGEVTARPRL